MLTCLTAAAYKNSSIANRLAGLNYLDDSIDEAVVGLSGCLVVGLLGSTGPLRKFRF
jgi:hypothetical protein